LQGAEDHREALGRVGGHERRVRDHGWQITMAGGG
jgi:hypothetical protein